MFGDFTIKYLRENFKELVKKYPEKFDNLKKLAGTMPKASKFGKVLDAIGIAESSVQLFFDLLIKLDGSGRIGYAQNIWRKKTEWFYYNSITSLLNNAIAVKTYSHLLNTLSSLMFSQQTICLKGPNPKTKEEAIRLSTRL